jgi:hypothetical protein
MDSGTAKRGRENNTSGAKDEFRTRNTGPKSRETGKLEE